MIKEDFKVGDMVRVVSESITLLDRNKYIKIGHTGVVRKISKSRPPIGVEWDHNLNNYGHDLEGTINNHKGYFVHPNALEIIVPLIEETDLNEINVMEAL